MWKKSATLLVLAEVPIADDEKVLVLQFLESGLPVLVSAAGVKFVCGLLSKFGIVLKNILKAELLGYGLT